MNRAVCDTSSIIRLTKGGAIDCLGHLFDQILIPPAVHAECQDEATRKQIQKPFFQVQMIRSILDFHVVMGQGECEAISLAYENQIPTIITDDLQAFQKAKESGLEPTTTMQVLLLAKELGFLSSVKSALDSMRRNGEGIEEKDYQDTLREAGEL